MRWSRVDAERGVATVDQSIVQVGREVSTKPPKSGEQREVPLPPFLILALKVHRARQAAWVIQCGKGYRRDLDLVSPRLDGSYWPPESFTDGYRRLVKRLGFPEFQGTHLLRHAYLTVLNAAGTDPKTLQSIGGHATAGFTLDHYCQIVPEKLRAAGAVVEQLFGPLYEQDAHDEGANSGKA